MVNFIQSRVAVIGLGAQGLVTVKNLLEEDYDVTGFDKNDYVGGIWHCSAERRVSALPSTIVNISRERACFTDFAFAEDASSYPTSAQMDRYLNDYCDHFELRSHLRLGTAVDSITRDDVKERWILTVHSTKSMQTESLEFEKIVMAVGPHCKPIYPDIQDQQKFKGEISHALTFKDPLHFKDKRVLVIGVSNTAADTTTSLVGIAKEVYLSHRHAAAILPRYLKDGSCIDHGMSFRISIIKNTIDLYFPNISPKLFDSMLARIITTEFGALDPEWNLKPTPSLVHQVPTVSDTLIPALRAGTITSTAVPRRIIGDHTVELQDGTTVEVDAIICCTGYHLDFSILGQHDPTLEPNGKTHDYRIPRLFQNIFSLAYPDSLAFIGIAIIFFPALLTSDLSSMALAQLWSTKPGSPSLPPQKDMERWHAEHCAWVSSIRALSPLGKFVKLSVRERPWLDWIEETTGTNVARNLGYTSLQAWRNWWQDPTFAGLLMGGIWTPHIYRVFDSNGRRKKWDGAREAIEKVNKHAQEDRKRRRESKIKSS